MSIKSFFAGIFGAAEKFAATELQKTVNALKAIVIGEQTIGEVVAADIKALTDSSLSGAAKFEQVLANTLPLLVNALTSIGAVADDLEDIARSLVQDVYNEVQSAKASGIVSAILKLLKIA